MVFEGSRQLITPVPLYMFPLPETLFSHLSPWRTPIQPSKPHLDSMVPEGPIVPSPPFLVAHTLLCYNDFVLLLPWRQFIIFAVMVLEIRRLGFTSGPDAYQGSELGCCLFISLRHFHY